MKWRMEFAELLCLDSALNYKFDEQIYEPLFVKEVCKKLVSGTIMFFEYSQTWKYGRIVFVQRRQEIVRARELLIGIIWRCCIISLALQPLIPEPKRLRGFVNERECTHAPTVQLRSFLGKQSLKSHKSVQLVWIICVAMKYVVVIKVT